MLASSNSSDSGLHSPYCAFVKARSLLGHATQRTMEIVHVSPATFFHVRQALTVEGQLALVLLNAFLNYGHGRNLLFVSDHIGSRWRRRGANQDVQISCGLTRR